MPKKKPLQVNNLIVFSDTHCGDQYGLCPRGGVLLDGGGIYLPSALQVKVWQWWDEFWGEWVPHVTRGEPYAVCLNGDAMEHRHHGATHQISGNLSVQGKIAFDAIKPIVEYSEGRFYLVRGTEAHCGPSAEEEEKLAERLGAVPDELGNYSRYELRLIIGRGARVHLLHHIGTTSSAAYESTAVNKELTEMYVDAGRWGRQPYDAVIRSHRHRALWLPLATKRGIAFSAVTPGWQLKTPFTYRVPGGRQTTPMFGGFLLRQGDEEFYLRHFVRSIDPPAAEFAAGGRENQ